MNKENFNDIYHSNLLIHGDNLLALKALEHKYTGKIKCIYIDPPYNTGKIFEHYNDRLQHEFWLNMMKERLILLHGLLSLCGSLWISIDSNESHYLKVLCDEIFERNNFINEIIWQRTNSPKLNKTFSRCHESILVYAKNRNKLNLNSLSRSHKQNCRYINRDNDPRGIWIRSNLSIGFPVKEKIYEIITPSGRKVLPPHGSSWRLTKEKYQVYLEDNRIWFGKKGNNIPAIKRFLSEVKEGITPLTLWLREDVGDSKEAKIEVKKINTDNVFQTPKPERLIQRVIQLATDPGDMVLDCFAGSGTSGAVAHKMDRKWIMIEKSESCTTHIIPRLKKVIHGNDQNGITESVEWKGGGEFIYYELIKENNEQEFTTIV